MSNERGDRIDSLFRIALVLLGIISSAVFQFDVQYGTTTTFAYSVRVTTFPFIILIGVWIGKELLKEWWTFKTVMPLTEFCWDFWTVTFFYYILSFVNFLNPGRPVFASEAALLLIPFIGLILVVQLTYRRIHKTEEYYKGPMWVVRSVSIFVATYLLLTFVVFPFEFFF